MKTSDVVGKIHEHLSRMTNKKSSYPMIPYRWDQDRKRYVPCDYGCMVVIPPDIYDEVGHRSKYGMSPYTIKDGMYPNTTHENNLFISLPPTLTDVACKDSIMEKIGPIAKIAGYDVDIYIKCDRETGKHMKWGKITFGENVPDDFRVYCLVLLKSQPWDSESKYRMIVRWANKKDQVVKPKKEFYKSKESTKKSKESTKKSENWADEEDEEDEESTKKSEESTKKSEESIKKPEESTKKSEKSTKKSEESTKKSEKSTKKSEESTKKSEKSEDWADEADEADKTKVSVEISPLEALLIVSNNK